MSDFNSNKFLSLIKASSFTLMIKLAGMFFGYIAMLFITRNYGAEEWGLYSLCLTTLSVAVLLPKFGFDSSLVRILAELNIDNKRPQIVAVLLKSIAISLGISILVIIVIETFTEFIVSNLIKQDDMFYYMKLISIAVIPVVLLTIISATFQALKKTALFMLFQTSLINIVFFILLLLYHYLGKEVSTFTIYVFSISIVLFLGVFFLLLTFRKFRINFRLTKGLTSKYSLKQISRISFPMMMSSSFVFLMSWTDIFMLSYYKTASDIGIYNSVLKLAGLSSIILVSINAIVTPKFVEFYTCQDINGLRDVVKKSTKLIFIATTPILIVLVLFSSSILGFFGEEFEAGKLALYFLCIAGFVNAMSGSVGYLMQMTDQQNVFQNVLIVAFLVNLVANIILIPIYSYNGAALASSLSMILWNIALVFIIKRKLGFWTFFFL